MSKLISLNERRKNVIVKECDEESRNKIKQKLSDIRIVNNLDRIKCSFSEKEIIYNKDSILEIEEQMEMWKYLSKLSVYLYNDYEFFSQLIIKTNFDFPMYNTVMKNLGYIQKSKAWFQGERPELDIIIHTIYNYCFYCFLFNAANTIVPNTEKNEPLRYCKLCESELAQGSVQCSICYTENPKDDQINLKPNKFRLPTEHKKEQLDIHVNEKSWKCEDCTFVNEEQNNCCVVCFTLKTPLTENTELDNNKKDEAKNIKTEDKINRAPQLDSKVDIKGDWVCQQCTFLNTEDTLHCTVCYNQRVNITPKEKEKLTTNISLNKSLTPDVASIKDKDNGKEDVQIIPKAEENNMIPENIADRKCKKCKQERVENDFLFCAECLKTHSICVNQLCKSLLGNKDKWCSSCGLKKDSDLKNANYVDVRKAFRFIQKWECGNCHRLLSKKKDQCKKCDRTRASFIN